MNDLAARSTASTAPLVRRSVLGLLVVLATVATTLGLFQAPASAVQHSNATGWYGAVTPYKVTNYDAYTSGPGAVVIPGLLVGGPVVGRSNGSVGWQTLGVVYVITRYHANGFTSRETFTYWYTIGAGVRSVKVPDFRRSVGAVGGTFNVQVALGWYDSAGRWLGGRGLNYNGGTNDYTCTYSHYVSCRVNYGSIWIG